MQSVKTKSELAKILWTNLHLTTVVTVSPPCDFKDLRLTGSEALFLDNSRSVSTVSSLKVLAVDSR